MREPLLVRVTAGVLAYVRRRGDAPEARALRSALADALPPDAIAPAHDDPPEGEQEEPPPWWDR
jgi:hypothetical protein